MPTRDALTRQIEGFLDLLSVERGLSAHTVAAYRRDLARYATFLRDRGLTDVRKVDERLVTSYVASVSASTYGDGRAYRATSVVRALSSVRAFHRFLLREGKVARDPTAAVVRPKLPRSLPKPLSVEDVARLLAQPDRSVAGIRDRAVLETLYGAGLRVSELVGLDVDDVDLEEGSVRALGKGGKERDVRWTVRPRAITLTSPGSARAWRLPARFCVGLNWRSGGRLTRQGAQGSSSSTRRRPASRRGSAPTRCGTRSRPTCSRAEPTCGWSRSCSGTRALPPPRYIRW
jgi:integrase/recombinase XerD